MKIKNISLGILLFFLPITALADTATYAVDHDGALFRQETTWSDTRDALDGEGTPNNTDTEFQVSTQQHVGTNTYVISRGFVDVFVDLPPGAVVDSAYFEIYVNSKNDGDNDTRDDIALYEGNQASTGVLINADYDQCGEVPHSDRFDIGAITTGAYTTLDLNPTGIAALDLNGWNKFCIREGHDADDVPIDGNTLNLTLNAAIDSGSPSTYPKLTINYHIASSSSSSSSSTPTYTGSLILTHSTCNDYILNGSGDAVGCNQWDTSIETEFIAAMRVEAGAIVFGAVYMLLRYLAFGYIIFILARWLFRTVTQWKPIQSIMRPFHRRR